MKRLPLLLCALGLLGLGMDKFRALRPEPSSDIIIRMPRLEKRTFPSGLQLVVHQDSYLPLVHIRLLLRTGYAAEPAEQKGVLLLLYRSLFSENEALVKALDALGTVPTVQLTGDGTTISVEVQSEDATSALGALCRALREPTWDEAALARVRQRAVSNISTRDTSPTAVAREVLLNTLYPADHPLHRQPRALAASIARLKLEDVQQAYRRHVVAKNVGVVIAGRMPPVVATAWVKRELGTLSDAAAPPSTLPVLVPKPRQEVLIIPYPDLAQTVITMGVVAPPIDDPQAPAIDAAAGWLSSYVSGKLREDKTISYGFSADYHGNWLGGEIILTGSVEARSTGYATREILSQLFAANSEMVSPQLMPLYRAGLINAITEDYTSLADTATAALSVLRRDGNFFPERIEKIQKLDTFNVITALREYIPEKNLTIVLAGDPQLIQSQVKSLGLGTLRIVDPL